MALKVRNNISDLNNPYERHYYRKRKFRDANNSRKPINFITSGLNWNCNINQTVLSIRARPISDMKGSRSTACVMMTSQAYWSNDLSSWVDVLNDTSPVGYLKMTYRLLACYLEVITNNVKRKSVYRNHQH
jgi:hypothetical protein